MTVLIGAIAYRSSPADEVEKHIESWEMIRRNEQGLQAKAVKCPKCHLSYALIEGLDATRELFQEDAEFLGKALSAAHPFHPARICIRDPNGVLNRYFKLIPVTM